MEPPPSGMIVCSWQSKAIPSPISLNPLVWCRKQSNTLSASPQPTGTYNNCHKTKRQRTICGPLPLCFVRINPHLLHVNAHPFKQLLADLSAMLDWQPARNTMRVRAGAQQQMMLAHIFQVGFDDLGAMVWMVDLDTINRYLRTHLIQQRSVI